MPYRDREKQKEYQRKWYQNNKEKIEEQYQKHKEVILKRKRQYYQEHKETRLEQKRKYYQEHKEDRNRYDKNRRKRDINFRVYNKLRKRIQFILKSRGNKKGSSTRELLGCNIRRFRKYIEGKFLLGMNWGNYGEWHLDHIRPCASFNLIRIEEQKQCFHYSNYRPLWASDNLSKGSFYDGKRYLFPEEQ